MFVLRWAFINRYSPVTAWNVLSDIMSYVVRIVFNSRISTSACVLFLNKRLIKHVHANLSASSTIASLWKRTNSNWFWFGPVPFQFLNTQWKCVFMRFFFFIFVLSETEPIHDSTVPDPALPDQEWEVQMIGDVGAAGTYTGHPISHPVTSIRRFDGVKFTCELTPPHTHSVSRQRRHHSFESTSQKKNNNNNNNKEKAMEKSRTAKKTKKKKKAVKKNTSVATRNLKTLTLKKNCERKHELFGEVEREKKMLSPELTVNSFFVSPSFLLSFIPSSVLVIHASFNQIRCSRSRINTPSPLGKEIN